MFCFLHVVEYEKLSFKPPVPATRARERLQAPCYRADRGARHTSHSRTTMPNEPGDDANRQLVLAENIRNLLYSLSSSTYDEIAPKIEYWIEFVLTEQFTTTDDLVGRLLPMAWENRGSKSNILRFLKEFRDSPHRSEQTEPLVDQLCLHILRWFAVASAEDLWGNWNTGPVSKCGGSGFVCAASFVGHLIEHGLLGRELVRRYLPKPLTAHYYDNGNLQKQSVRANAIYNLLTAGNTLLQGLLDPEDVRVCFERLEARIPLGKIAALDTLDAVDLNVRCDSRLNVSYRSLTCGLETPHYPRCVVAAQRGRAPQRDGHRRSHPPSSPCRGRY